MNRLHSWVIFTLVLNFVLLLFPFQVIAENLSEEEIKGLKEMFNNMDTDRSGTITYEELKTGLSRLGSTLTEEEIRQLMDAVRNLVQTKQILLSFLLID